MSDTTSTTAAPAAAAAASVASAAAVPSPDQDHCLMDDFERCRLALLVVLQNDTPNALQDAATFSRLLCANRELGESLQKAAVGRLSVSVSVGPKVLVEDPYTGCGLETEVRISSGQQVCWIAAQLQRHTLRHIHVQGVTSEMLHALDEVPKAVSLIQWLRICRKVAYIDQHGLWLTDPDEEAAAVVEALQQQQEEKQGDVLRVVPVSPEMWELIVAAEEGWMEGVSCGLMFNLPAPRTSSPQQPPAATYHLTQLSVQHLSTDPQLAHHDDFFPPEAVQHAVDGFPDVQVAHVRDHRGLQLLCQLTSLQELSLTTFNPAAGALAPVLCSLTHLTKLFIRHPLEPEQQALPMSLRELTVAREYLEHEGCDSYHLDLRTPEPLPALHIAHLTALEKLRIVESHRSLDDEYSRKQDRSPIMCQGVPVESKLPVCLQQLQVKAVPHVEPLLGLTALHTLSISHLSVMKPADLVSVTQLTSLTRVELPGDLDTDDMTRFEAALHLLHMRMKGARVQYGTRQHL